MTTKSTRRIPKRGVADRYGVSLRTITRWQANTALNFPKPAAVINERPYWAEDTLDEFDAASVKERLSRPAA